MQKPPGSERQPERQQHQQHAHPADQQPQVNAAVLQRPSDRPLTPPPGFAQPFPEQDPNARQQPNTLANNGPLPPITLQPQQGPGALPPITLQAGGTNQPGGLPPITLAPVGGQSGQGGQQVPGVIPGQGAGGFPAGGGDCPNHSRTTRGRGPGRCAAGIPDRCQRATGAQHGCRSTNSRAEPRTEPRTEFPGRPQGIPGQTMLAATGPAATPARQPEPAWGCAGFAHRRAEPHQSALDQSPPAHGTGPVGRQSDRRDRRHRQHPQGAQHQSLQRPKPIRDVGVRVQPHGQHGARRRSRGSGATPGRIDSTWRRNIPADPVSVRHHKARPAPAARSPFSGLAPAAREFPPRCYQCWMKAFIFKH